MEVRFPVNVVAVPMTIPLTGGKKLGIVEEIRLAVGEARRAHPGLGALVDITVKRLEDRVRLVLFFAGGERSRR